MNCFVYHHVMFVYLVLVLVHLLIEIMIDKIQKDRMVVVVVMIEGKLVVVVVLVVLQELIFDLLIY